MQVSYLANKSFSYLLMLLALWHATADACQPTNFAAVLPFYTRVVQTAFRNSNLIAYKAAMLGEEALSAMFETLLQDGFLCYSTIPGYASHHCCTLLWPT